MLADIKTHVDKYLYLKNEWTNISKNILKNITNISYITKYVLKKYLKPKPKTSPLGATIPDFKLLAVPNPTLFGF